jgi:hypothetical protein
MKYETPHLTTLAPAINAIQTTTGEKVLPILFDGPTELEGNGAYADWE